MARNGLPNEARTNRQFMLDSGLWRSQIRAPGDNVQATYNVQLWALHHNIQRRNTWDTLFNFVMLVVRLPLLLHYTLLISRNQCSERRRVELMRAQLRRLQNELRSHQNNVIRGNIERNSQNRRQAQMRTQSPEVQHPSVERVHGCTADHFLFTYHSEEEGELPHGARRHLGRHLFDRFRQSLQQSQEQGQREQRQTQLGPPTYDQAIVQGNPSTATTIQPPVVTAPVNNTTTITTTTVPLTENEQGTTTLPGRPAGMSDSYSSTSSEGLFMGPVEEVTRANGATSLATNPK